MIYTVLLLIVSNVFMTFAWYGHLRHRQTALWLTIIISWAIAFFEYCFQVPANRMGFNRGWSGAQLKTVQEVITLCVFVAFAAFYLKETIRWNVIIGFFLIFAGAACVFAPWARTSGSNSADQAIRADDSSTPRTDVVTSADRKS